MSTAVRNAPAQFAPTASQLDVAYSVCRSIARAAAKNFYYGFAVLPRRKRNALSAVYAFMRRCDDIADDNTQSLDDRYNKLAEWLNKLHRSLAAQPTDDPVLLALTDAQRKYQIPIGLLDELAYGTAADLDPNRSESTIAAPLVARYRTFEELRHYCYGVAAVVAVFHDTLITVGAFSLSNQEITLTVIAAILTLIGYSMNDTIVVFDRIRENLRISRRENLTSVVNRSINQTLSRTVLTSGLTFLTVLSLYLFGGEVLHGFSFALVIGILIGTYSSIAVAAPMLVAYQEWRAKRGKKDVLPAGKKARV